MPVIPTLMGWGTIPDDHPLMAGMCGLQTSHRYGNATMLASDFVLGIGNRWANRHTGSVEIYTKGRKFVHVDIEPTQIGRVFSPDFGIVSDAKAALELFVQVAKEWKAAGKLADRSAWAADCQQRKGTCCARPTYDNVPMKPQRVYQEMNEAFGEDVCYVSTIGLSQIAGAQFLHVYKPRHWINCGQAGPLGWTVPAALGVRAADPTRKIVALSGDYDFQFMIEELAVGAQFKLPYIHVVVNNSYLGLIRQAQRGFDMDYCVQLGFDNINTAGRPGGQGYGVDHVKVVEGLGCKAIRVHQPEELAPAIAAGRSLDGGVPGAGGDRGHPRARHQHRHGHRDRQHHRVRGPGRQHAADAPTAVAAHAGLSRYNGDNQMPKFAANLTMLFNELPFLERFAAASAAGFEAVEYLFPYAFDKNELAQAAQDPRPQAGAAQPAGRRLGRAASAASPATRTAWTSSATAWTGHRLRHGAGLPAAQLPGRQAARRREPRAGACHLRRQSAVRRRQLKAAGIRLLIEPINSYDIPGFFLNTHRRRPLAILDEVGSDNLFIQYDIYHAQRMEGELAATVQKHLAAHRPHPAGRQPGPQRAGHRRNQLSLPVPPPRRHRLHRLDRLRVQAQDHARSKAWAGSRP